MQLLDQIGQGELDETGCRILEAAVEHFSRDGYWQTAVEQVAATASVGNGTVYRRFGNKEKLFFAALQYVLRSLWELVGRHIEEMTEPVATIRAICKSLAEYYCDHPQLVEMMMIERAEFRSSVFPMHLRGRQVFKGRAAELMRRAMSRSPSRHRISPEDAANAFMDLMFGAAVNGLLENDKEHLKSRMSSALELFLMGLVGDAILTTGPTVGRGDNESATKCHA